MTNLGTKYDLSAYRLEKAYRMLKSAALLVEDEDYLPAANRSYYAIFHAMRAVLALDELDEHKHSHLISEFRRRYLKTEILDRSLSETISNLFEVRNSSDYNDGYVIARADVVTQIAKATEFIRAIEVYLKGQGVEISNEM